MSKRLYFFVFLTPLLLGGCTFKPTLINVLDSKYEGAEYRTETSSQPVFVLQREDLTENRVAHRHPPQEKSPMVDDDSPLFDIAVPERRSMPSIPLFTDEELRDRHLVEQGLVNHIGELRMLITEINSDLDAYEQTLREKTPDGE